MPTLFSWRDVLNWPRDSSAAGRNLAGGRGASQPGSKLSVCFNLEEKLLWPSGDAERAVLKSGDCTLPVKHLRYYRKFSSGPGWGRELPVNRTLFFYVQGIS